MTGKLYNETNFSVEKVGNKYRVTLYYGDGKVHEKECNLSQLGKFILNG
jgi:hypothetical protein